MNWTADWNLIPSALVSLSFSTFNINFINESNTHEYLVCPPNGISDRSPDLFAFSRSEKYLIQLLVASYVWRRQSKSGVRNMQANNNSATPQISNFTSRGEVRLKIVNNFFFCLRPQCSSEFSELESSFIFHPWHVESSSVTLRVEPSPTYSEMHRV